MTKPNVESILSDLETCSEDIQAFTTLSAEQFNWKPSAERWSVAQCIDHLRLANLAYQDVITGALDENRTATVWERIPFLPKFFGNLLINSLKPGGRGIKTTESFKPTQSDFELSLIADFEASQQSICKAIESVSHFDMPNIIVTSVFARFVTYSLYDACKIVAVHERRHIVQAQDVMKAEGFPS